MLWGSLLKKSSMIDASRHLILDQYIRPRYRLIGVYGRGHFSAQYLSADAGSRAN